ncbi:MAG: ACT domain-containing protein [Bacillota bacterium]|nr:ACT domain-containing protein [Bacillota bacterium]
MKAVITVIGEDKIGIIAKVTNVLAEDGINILDISQTILDKYFTMIMLTDISKMSVNFKELNDKLTEAGNKIGVSIKIQHQDIFNAMHKI